MDGLLLSEKVIKGELFRLAVVCDGVGSTCGGAYASAEVLCRLQKWFNEIQDYKAIGQKFLIQM